MKPRIIFLWLFALLLSACSSNEQPMKYDVSKLSSTPEINAKWDKTQWEEISPLYLTQFMGEKPAHFPSTKAKVAYDDEAIYVIFQVEDKYVKAVYSKNQDPVYKDSCVEFFFSPSGNISKGYFNLEMNCGGTMLFHHQVKPRTSSVQIDKAHIDQIEVAHSLPKIVDPEIEANTTWVVEYRIPFSILSGYHDFTKPERGTIWRANFYKCADDTSHPHWLTWAPVDNPTPNFHMPAFFGTLVFD